MVPQESYIHGYSIEEQHRLIQQAAVLTPNIHRGLDLSSARNLLELGCGTGAELHYLRTHWAHLALTGIDRHGGHLAGAAEYLGAREVVLVQADAAQLPFPDHHFDCVMTVWMLEHAHRPRAVLREALRVLNPRGRLICIEVDNETLRLEPPQPVISRWIAAFNRVQGRIGGDPYIGRRLWRLARELGGRDITTETLPILSTQFEPARRREILQYLETLLRSGAEAMLAAGVIQPDQIRALGAAFAQVHQDPTIEARYFAVRLCCRPGSDTR